MISTFSKIIFSIFTFTLVLVIVEGSARIYWSILKAEAMEATFRAGEVRVRDRRTSFILKPDKQYGYLLEPGRYSEPVGDSDGAIVNQNGFWQGNVVPLEKDSARFRILAFGESTTQGNSIQCNWPVYLKEIAGMNILPESEIELLNTAVPGWLSDFTALRTERELAGYRPDLAILYVGWNDFLYYDPILPGPERSAAEFDSNLAFVQEFPLKFVALALARYEAFMLSARQFMLSLQHKSETGGAFGNAVRLLQPSEWVRQGAETIDPGNNGEPRFTIANQMYTYAPRPWFDPKREYVYSVSLKGAGRLRLQANGITPPWPFYNSCDIDLSAEWKRYSCPFRPADNLMDLQLSLINIDSKSPASAVIGDAAVYENRTGIDIEDPIVRKNMQNVADDAPKREYGAPASETYRFYVNNLDRIVKAIKRANPEAKIAVSTLVGRWPTGSVENFNADSKRFWMIDKLFMDRNKAAESLERFNGVIRQFARSNSLPLLDPALSMKDIDRASMMLDFSHFDCNGYRLLAERLYKDLQQNVFPAWKAISE